MKRKIYVLLCLILCLLLVSCGSILPDSYAQKVLSAPDAIEVRSASTAVTYEPGSAEYEKLWGVLTQNWWKTVEKEPDTASIGDLTEVTHLKELKTSRDHPYLWTDETTVRLYYKEEPLLWTSFDGEEVSIQTICYIVPQYVEGFELVKGLYTASETDEIGVNEGIYAYYFPAEALENGFWSWLVHDQA